MLYDLVPIFVLPTEPCVHVDSWHPCHCTCRVAYRLVPFQLQVQTRHDEPTCVSSTDEGLTDVSSCSSRAPAASRGSFSSTKPPGSAHLSCALRHELQMCAPCNSHCTVTCKTACISVHATASFKHLENRPTHQSEFNIPYLEVVLMHHEPTTLTLNGSFFRLISSSCAGSPCATITVSTVTAGRGYLKPTQKRFDGCPLFEA